MINEQLLDKCIEDYNSLNNLTDLSEQQRGQRFNSLIARVLNAHRIYAIHDQRSKGEIDVCFRIRDKRFLLEAKWEKAKTNIDPIAKLGLRIKQRVPDSFGILLSMNGFTQEVLKEINQAGRPLILLFEKDIFETLLHANIDAEVLFDASIDAVSFEGKLHIKLADIFKYLPVNNIDIKINTEIETESERKIAPLLTPEGNIKKFNIVKANLPFGQNGISVLGETVFVTLSDGLYKIDNKAFLKILNVASPQNRCLYDKNRQLLLFVLNGSVMALDNRGVPISISKRYPGHVRIFKNKDEIHLFSNGNLYSTPKQPVRIVEDLLGKQKEIILDYPISCGSDSCLTYDGCFAVIGSQGLVCYRDAQRIWTIDDLTGSSVASFNSRLYVLENGVSLTSIRLDGKRVNNICKFDLSGSVGDFAIADENEYYFHLCYHESNITKTAIVYIKTA